MNAWLSIHLSVKPISRASGRSAAAAYRAGELIHDERSQETFDSTRKRGVEHKGIVLPSSAAMRDINWARDRQTLWNAAEAAENRSNSISTAPSKGAVKVTVWPNFQVIVRALPHPGS